MATLSRFTLARAGIAITYASAAGGGDVVDNADGKTLLHVKNGSGGSINVTVTAQTTSISVPQGEAEVSNKVIAVAAGAEKIIGPFEAAWFNNASGQLAITYSSATTVTIATYKMP